MQNFGQGLGGKYQAKNRFAEVYSRSDIEARKAQHAAHAAVVRQSSCLVDMEGGSSQAPIGRPQTNGAASTGAASLASEPKSEVGEDGTLLVKFETPRKRCAVKSEGDEDVEDGLSLPQGSPQSVAKHGVQAVTAGSCAASTPDAIGEATMQCKQSYPARRCSIAFASRRSVPGGSLMLATTSRLQLASLYAASPALRLGGHAREHKLGKCYEP